MGLQQKRTDVSAGIPVFQTILEWAQGGFTLDRTGFDDDFVIKAGSIIGYDESTRIAQVLKVAKVQANAANNATVVRIEKGSPVIVGNNLGKTVGGAAYAITAIDTANAAYDAVTLGTTLGVALTAGDILFVSSGNGASAAAFAVTPKGLLYEDTIVGTDTDVSVILRGTVYDRRIPGSGTALKTVLPLIIFSQSF